MASGKTAKLSGIAVLLLSASLFLGARAQASTFSCRYVNKGTAMSVGGDLSFDGSTTSLAFLNTFAGTLVCNNPALSGNFHGQGVNQYLIGTTPCTFKGIFGESESGVDTTLVGIVYNTDGPNGSAFYTGKTESGCFSPTTGAFTGTETDELFAGIGAYKGATGTSTYTVRGFVLGPPPVTGAFGFFEWYKIKGTGTVKLP